MMQAYIKTKGWVPVISAPKQWESFSGSSSHKISVCSQTISKDWIRIFRRSTDNCMFSWKNRNKNSLKHSPTHFTSLISSNFEPALNFADSSNIFCAQHIVSLKKLTPRRKHFPYVENQATPQTMLEAPAMQAHSRPARSTDSLQKLAGELLDAIESCVFPFLESQFPLPSTSNPDIQLQGNFAPVPERRVQHQLPVSGKLPSCLQGVYIRNGANPRFKPLAGHHLFDGDGMLHAVKFHKGNASYCCRFTRTHRLVEEERVGRAFFPKAIGELHGHGGIARLLLLAARSFCGVVDASKGMGVANAGLIFFNGRLLAMSEDDLPYAVAVRENGDLNTLGRYDFKGQLCSSMTAHPKKDPETGELFALSYDVVKKPYLKYFFFTADGKKSTDVCISLKQPTMMHDFAITKNFVVIPDQQVVFKMQELLRGGSPVVYDRSKSSRFGILPKYDSDESRMKWIDVLDCFCFHLWNAWEEGEYKVVVIGSCMTPPDCIFNESEEELRSVLCEIGLNLKTGLSTKRKIARVNLEAGQVNRRFLGRKSRYAYLAIAEPWPKVSGIAKVDFESSGKDPEDKVMATFMHGENCYGGEPFFVPRSERSDETAAEDDGFLLTFRHNEKTELSEVLVLDARSPSLELIASVKLPSRVPYGFHGTFLTSKNLAEQTFCL